MNTPSNNHDAEELDKVQGQKIKSLPDSMQNRRFKHGGAKQEGNHQPKSADRRTKKMLNSKKRCQEELHMETEDIVRWEVSSGMKNSNRSAMEIIDSKCFRRWERVDKAEFVYSLDHSEKTIKFSPHFCISSSSVEAMLMVKLKFSVFLPKHVSNVVHPLSPIQLPPALTSCIRCQNEQHSDHQEMAIIRDSSSTTSTTSESEDSEPGYRNLATTDPLIGGLVRRDDQEEDPREIHRKTDKSSINKLLSWNERKQNKPLLNKVYGEDGGHDIDQERSCQFSRQQPRTTQETTDSRVSGFGNIRKHSGEEPASSSHNYRRLVASQLPNPTTPLDHLEWRNLCEDAIYRSKFSDQHFNLDTVIKAQIRPLMLTPERAYVGFFELEEMPSQLDFLQGAMSFDNVWEEGQNSKALSEQIYDVCWNDHFFVLKVEDDAIFLIDTLEERLTGDGDKAFTLKFNKESKVCRIHQKAANSNIDEGNSMDGHASNHEINKDGSSKELVCEGKSSCKEFTKGSLQTTHSESCKPTEGKSEKLLSVTFYKSSFITQLPATKAQNQA
ncbi:hypothetical protein RJ641_036170 [Dillenia turbinata]|uniref:Uncharacterized protein n=1 Tax=Dillenia turbinata TaxID=194707 RepID=A0AAN8VNP0_9MAGN